MNETKNPAVNPAAEDDEISLIDLLAVILRYKWMILGICAEAAIAVLAFSVVSLLLPPEKSPDRIHRGAPFGLGRSSR